MTDVPADISDDTSGVAATIAAYCAAYNLGERPFDMKGVERFYRHDGPLMIAIPAAPDRLFLSWNEYRTAWAGTLENFQSFGFSTGGDLVVSRIGRVAWASQTGHSHGKRLDGTEFRRALRQTLVLALDGEEWRIVQEHVSLIAA